MLTDTLRPTSFKEYIGQEDAIEELQLHIDAARMAVPSQTLDPILLTGGAGFGKTSLAEAIAYELHDPFTVIQMPMKSGDYSILRNHLGVVLLDELHMVTKRQATELQQLLEFGWFQPTSGPMIEPAWLSVIGATTERGDIVEPLRDRFVIQPYIRPYTLEELGLIIEGMATKAGIEFGQEEALALGRASGFVPRRARGFVLKAKALRDTGKPVTVEEILRISHVTFDGLGQEHIAYLELLGKQDNAIGDTHIATMLNTDVRALRELERLLVGRLKLVDRTRLGRMLTPAGVRRAQELKMIKEMSR